MAKRSFGTVRRLASGRYQARYRDGTGGQKGAPGTFATKADATRWLARMQADIDRGQFFDPHAGKVTLAEYAESWVTTRLVKGRPLAPRTVELYRSQLSLHILPSLGGIELRRLESQAVRAWFGRLSGPQGPGRSTAAKCYRLLRAICATAVEEDLIQRNPCTIRGAGQEPSSHRAMLTPQQVDQIADAVGDRWRAMVLMAAWCGLRFGELAALRRHRLDLDAGTVAVVEAASGGRIGPPKSDAGKRVVAVPPHVLPALRHHVEHYSQAGPKGLVFVGIKGRQLNNANFGADVWRPALLRVEGLPPLTFHDLRGVSATMAARAGATTRDLMLRLGHSTPAMSLRYQRAEAERDQAIASAMSAAVEAAVRHDERP